MAFPKIKCVYGIKNKVNGKMYIGSTKNLRSRRYQHYSKLKGNYHRNKELQKDYNKYGKENFEFVIIKKVKDEIDLIKTERKEIGSRENIYNIIGNYKSENENKNTLNIKKLRNQIGITQKQLSGLTGIDEANISKLENDKIELYDGWKERIELAFELFEEERNEN